MILPDQSTLIFFAAWAGGQTIYQWQQAYCDIYSLQVWAIIVFGCIAAEGWYRDQCQMNGDANACNYGVGIGVLAFLICLAFLVVDALFENISSVQYRKYVVIADMCVSGMYIFAHII